MLFRKKKKEMKKVFELEFEGKKFVVEAGEIAKQADGAVLVRLNETAVLSTACASDLPKEGDFFPLTVGYECSPKDSVMKSKSLTQLCR